MGHGVGWTALCVSLSLGGALLCTGATAEPPATVRVRDVQAFRQALAQAKPGARIELAPGEYAGGIYLADVRGEEGKPIVIAAADPKAPPRFRGGAAALHLVDPAWVELRDLVFAGQTANGLNIDDGGSLDTPAHHIVLHGLRVSDVGSDGNHDGVKLSGVDDFRVEDCTVERWGTGGGSAVDMVGCHRGVFEGNTFRHREDAMGNTGIQAKGGTSEIVIRHNRFENSGGRAVNLGGSTGLAYFRPPLGEREEQFEARSIVVEGNTFIGGGAPVAFVGVDGAIVRFNTIYCPRRWALRILQETRAPGFVPSRRGEFTDNIVVFRSGQWSEGGVNIGPGTASATFRFARNWWYCVERPGDTQSLVTLPTPEVEGTYGRDPQFRDAATGDLRLTEGSPAEKVGAMALPQ